MILDTQFDLGQEVHVFARRHHELFDLCEQCGGRGKVAFIYANGEGEGETYCPNRDCRNGRVRSVWHDVWEYAGNARIGQIEVRVRERYEREPEREERYMLDTTGIGTGTVYVYDGKKWSHTHLFATQHEGQAWALEANKPLRAEADEKRSRMLAEVAA